MSLVKSLIKNLQAAGLTVPASPTLNALTKWVSATELAESVIIDTAGSLTGVKALTMDGNLDLTATATNQIIMPQNDSSTNPGIQLNGSGNGLGIYALSPTRMAIATNGIRRWIIDSFILGSLAGGPAMIDVASSSTIPVFVRGNESTTGVGFPGTGAGCLTALGVEVVRFAKGASSQPALHFPEITTPTPIADMGSYYTKSDNKAYFQDGAGVEHEIAFV